jgi:peptidylprolyl isomerase
MRRLAALALLPLIAAQAPTPPPAKPRTPNDVVAAAPAESWRTIDAEDLLVMTLEGGAQVVIQLAPGFAPVHVANIRKMAEGSYWQGSGVYRVQDNYVAQWGLGEAERPMPAGVVKLPPHEYWRSAQGLDLTPLKGRDSYASRAGFSNGWPVAVYADGSASLTHCYGTVGVARDLAPDTGSGSELYAIIGHAPRQLDRNIAIVGRVISGIDKLSSLPRGTENLGFYAKDAKPKPIQSVQLASTMQAATRPSFQYLDTRSKDFAAYAHLRANRNDDFYRVAAGGVDLCNVSVPVRPTPTK